jgi:ubiquinol-cytochrome c reductase cytochrome b subunit
MWAEGANDVLADRFDVPLYTITWIARIAFFVVPVAAYFVTKRICLALQRKDANMLVHGVEIGIIRQLPNGEFVEEERPLTEEERGVIDSKHVYQPLPTADNADDNGVPAPSARGPMGFARKLANRAFTETYVMPEGDGHGHGYGDHEELEHDDTAAIGGSSPEEH